MKRKTNTKRIMIAPSILASNFTKLGDEIQAVEKAGADLLHIDVMDGRFVPNITIGQPVIHSIRRITKLPLDVHLMIEDPMDHIKSFIDAGADILTVHLEASTHLHKAIRMIKDSGVKAGVSLNPATPVVMLKDIIEELDLVLIMTVNPGFGGQEFIKSTLKKIKELNDIKQQQNLHVMIEVDGGINIKNAGLVAKNGVDIIVAGTAIFRSKDYKEVIGKLRTSSSA